MFTKFILVAFVWAAATAAIPLTSPTATICSGSLDPPSGCEDIPVASADCINLVGGLSFFNKEISNATVPNEFVCAFYEAFGCLAMDGFDVAVLTSGAWDFSLVNGTDGEKNFNDLTSSFCCKRWTDDEKCGLE
ncbi:hypothetical protein BDZ89DRAFT_1046636 [Hymenopellis radicata]|nr:hypothetical protein BDZ89DRAFT_1046636 [Hymenopellis radicata]